MPHRVLPAFKEGGLDSRTAAEGLAYLPKAKSFATDNPGCLNSPAHGAAEEAPRVKGHGTGRNPPLRMGIFVIPTNTIQDHQRGMNKEGEHDC